MTRPTIKLRTAAQDAQAMKALEKAQETRRLRGQLRRALKAGQEDFDAILKGNDPRWEPVAREMKLIDFLLLMPGIGNATALDVIEQLELRPKVTLEALTFARRAEIAQMVKAALELDPVTAPPPQVRPVEAAPVPAPEPKKRGRKSRPPAPVEADPSPPPAAAA